MDAILVVNAGSSSLKFQIFDIADVGNAALAAVRTATDLQTRLVLVDLKTGAARLLGRVGEGAPLVGIAIEP